MNRIKVGLLLALLGIAGCDPYQEDDTSQPRVVRLIAYGGVSDVQEASAPTGDAWVLPDVALDQANLRVDFSKVMKGDTIQTLASASQDTCVIAPNLTATVTPEQSGPLEVCYDPTSADPVVGGAIVIKPEHPGLDADENPLMPPSTTYRVFGTVQDHQGNQLPIDVSFVTAAQ
jgi:hypothetical protein